MHLPQPSFVRLLGFPSQSRLAPENQDTPVPSTVAQALSVEIGDYVSGTSSNYPAISDPAPAGMPTDCRWDPGTDLCPDTELHTEEALPERYPCRGHYFIGARIGAAGRVEPFVPAARINTLPAAYRRSPFEACRTAAIPSPQVRNSLGTEFIKSPATLTAGEIASSPRHSTVRHAPPLPILPSCRRGPADSSPPRPPPHIPAGQAPRPADLALHVTAAEMEGDEGESAGVDPRSPRTIRAGREDRAKRSVVYIARGRQGDLLLGRERL